MSQGCGEEMLREKEKQTPILNKKSWPCWPRPEAGAPLQNAPPRHPTLRSRREAPPPAGSRPPDQKIVVLNNCLFFAAIDNVL